MRVGFCITSDDQGVSFHLLEAASLGRLLTFRQTDQTTVALVGRLYYRRELVDALGHDTAVGDLTDDATLVLAAYERWGRSGLERLEGCFSLAVWDARERKLYGRRDLLGSFPLYWGQRGGRFAVGTSLRAVSSWISVAELDQEYQAEYLMLQTCGTHELPCERTPYLGVQCLRPQNLLSVKLPDGRAEVHEYWNWLDRLEEPKANDLSALAARYLDLLRGAVQDRMAGRTAAHVSGGLDSTTVALLALSEIERGAAEGPLHTISLVYESMAVLARERSAIEGAVSGREHAVPHFIAADGLLDFAPYAVPPDHEEPWPWLSMAGTEMARTATADRAGVETVLTGQGADEFLDMGPYHLTDLLRRGRLLQAWREASACARAENCGVWPILYPFGVRNLLPAWSHDGLQPLLHSGFTDWLNMGDGTIPPWVRPSYAKRYHLRDRALACGWQHWKPGRPALISIALSKIEGRIGDLGRWYLSAPRGILVEHPFLDPRLICFLLGVHARTSPLPRTVPKPLLVEAVKGTVPDNIRLRNKAGFFNEPYFRGIAQHADALERLISSNHSAASDWLDPTALIHCLRQSALGIGNDRIQMDRMNVALSWLRWQSLSPNRAAPEVDDSVVYRCPWAGPIPVERTRPTAGCRMNLSQVL